MNPQGQQFLLIPLFSLSAYTLTILTGSQKWDETPATIFVTLIGTETNTPEEEITGGFARVCIHSLKSQLCLKSGTVFAVLELLLSFP